MNPTKIKDHTRVMGEEQEEFQNLHIRDDRTADGYNVMTSDWKPTPDELEMLAYGGTVRLMIIGEVHPPVLLVVNPAQVN